MNIVCLDMEGVLVPEMWLAFADATKIAGLERTTRDEPDYDVLMRTRLDILHKHNMKIQDVQDVIATMQPIDGAREFLDELRTLAQVIILSDTFEQFAKPLIEKLNWPTLFCNTLVIDSEGSITDYKMRCVPSKLTTVRALQSCGYETICAGDSLNDIGMIKASKAGFLFRTTPEIKLEHPEIPTCETFDELLCAIKENL